MRATETAPTVKDDVRRMSTVQLARLGVELLNKHGLVLRCTNCGESWTAHTDSNGRLFSGYWVCPNKCNL
jgi:hypothetical protein